jgi:RNA polymerase sigma-70 factor, ECF subfamily
MTGPDSRSTGVPGEPDQAALLREIHDAHGPQLQRYVLRLTRGDREFAEDVVQEALLRLWQKPAVLEQSSDSVRAWLFTVARNLVIDDRRSARYNRELQPETMPERPSPDAIGPAFDKWLMSDALVTLTPEHRAVLVRSYYLGQTAAEIAQHEGIPAGTVKSRQHYALRALRIALQERGVVR